MPDREPEGSSQSPFRRAVTKWRSVVTILALLVATGVVQITPARVYLDSTQTALAVVFGLFVLSTMVALVLNKELKALRVAGITDDQPAVPLPPIREVALDALEERLARQTVIQNELHLQSMQLVVKVHGNDSRLDAHMMWQFAGHNSTNHLVGDLGLYVSGDRSTSWSDLDARYFDLLKDRGEGEALEPVCVEEAAFSKRLSLPFDDPGLYPKAPFALKLHLTWRGMVTRGGDYWLLDTTNFGRVVDELRFSLHYPVGSLKNAYLLEGALGQMEWQRRYRVGIDSDHECDHVILIERPGASQRVYIVVVEWDDGSQHGG